MGEIYSFLYQVMSPVVKQCDRKSVHLWWLSSVLCPSTFCSRSLSKAHLKCTVCSLWMTHPRENELQGAGSLANKHFTICSLLKYFADLKSDPADCKYKLWQTNSASFCLWGTLCKMSYGVDVPLQCNTCDVCISEILTHTRVQS